MYTKCGHCGEILDDPGTDFTCPKCGTPIQTRAEFFEPVEVVEEGSPEPQYREMTLYTVFKAIASGGSLLAIMAYTLMLVLCILVYFYAIPTVLVHWPELSAIPFIIVPMPIGLVELQGYAAAAYWIFIVVMFGAALFWLVWPERAQLKKTVLGSLPKVRAPARSNKTTFVVLAQMFLAIMFFDYLYYFLIELTNTSTNTPAFEENKLWENLYGFLNASVWEEIAARVLLIGAPFLLFLLVKSIADNKFTEKTLDTNKAFRRVLRVLVGGHGEFTPVTAGLIVFSALMFGFAHAPGWDMYKVLPTAVSGLGFGYIYVKNGLHGAIMLHFSFDYLGMAEGFLPNNTATQSAMAFILILWLAVGMIYFIYYGAKMIRYFAEPDEGWKRPLEGTGARLVWDLVGWK